jgi:hypothetical protein
MTSCRVNAEINCQMALCCCMTMLFPILWLMLLCSSSYAQLAQPGIHLFALLKDALKGFWLTVTTSCRMHMWLTTWPETCVLMPYISSCNVGLNVLGGGLW